MAGDNTNGYGQKQTKMVSQVKGNGMKNDKLRHSVTEMQNTHRYRKITAQESLLEWQKHLWIPATTSELSPLTHTKINLSSPSPHAVLCPNVCCWGHHAPFSFFNVGQITCCPWCVDFGNHMCI